MGLFKRDKDVVEPGGISGFWTWWQESGAVACAAALDDGDPRRVAEELTAQVAGIYPGLAWDLAPGDSSRHVLVVSAAGDPALRRLARKWLRAAPPADATWAYADTRQAAPALGDRTVEAGGRIIGMEEVLVAARRAGHRYDVVVHHPVFSELPESDRLRVASQALDAALGETSVELWVRRTTAAVTAPASGMGLDALRALIDELRAECLGSDGEPSWVEVRGEGPKGPFLIGAQVPLSPAYAPHLNHHLTVRLPYVDRTEGGLPGPLSERALDGFTRWLGGELQGNGRVVAHETVNGSRTLHVYVDSSTSAEDALRVATSRWEQGRVRIGGHPDPAWGAVAHLRR